MKKKNSLIELYRFIFAMNVVKNHGYFPYQGKYVGPGRISVEFFFVLSGWFLIKSVDKLVDLPFWKGLWSMLKNKVVKLGIPLAIGLLFNISYEFIVGVEGWRDFSIWGYMWYIHDMLIVFIFYYTIRRLIKSKKWFIAFTAGVFVASSVIHAFPNFYSWGYFRAFSAMSAGILISFLPEIKLKKQWVLIFPLVLVWAAVLKMLVFDFTFIEEEILDLILYPALIYLTFQFSFGNAFFNYLGSLSFGLYAYQSIPRMINALGYNNVWVSFAIIITFTVATDFIKRAVNRSRSTGAE